jgi:benzodiazapine receptor
MAATGLASFSAAAYAVLVVSGVFMHFERTGNLRALAHGLSRPGIWIAFVIAALVAWGLWKRYAWAWWLGAAAAAFQLWRLTSWYVQGPLGRLPGTITLLMFALLILLLVLLAQRSVRASCSR